MATNTSSYAKIWYDHEKGKWDDFDDIFSVDHDDDAIQI